ncbi:MAG: hypothetical protein ACI91Z_000006 [Yoonia sp.]|jgi:hypothetical protein
MNYDDVLKELPHGQEGFAPCFAFSVHKSGSTMLHNMLHTVSEAAQIQAASIPDMVFNHGILDKDWSGDPDIIPYFRRNLLYYGFRAFPTVLNDPSIALSQHRFVLLVRDPRDALVSEYFSYGKKGGSHSAPDKNADAFEDAHSSALTRAQDNEIDDYVLRASRDLLGKLNAYRAHLNFDVGLLRRYEDAYFDKESLLRDTLAHLQIDVAPDLVERVAAQFDVRPTQEDDSQHIRKGTPGDHAEKLRPETIAALNDKFRDVGAFFGYTL